MHRHAGLTAILGILFVAGCHDELPTNAQPPRAPSFSISDGAHAGGNRHFYFLPPLVREPVTSGVFDSTLDPVVTICAWDGADCVGAPVAEFTSVGLGGDDGTSQFYMVNWHTDQSALLPDRNYRIRVLVAGTELGHADVDVVANGRELRNVDTDQSVGLVNGRTLPIKFRIEQGAVGVIGPEGGTVHFEGGNVTIAVPPGALAGPLGFTVQPGAVGPTELTDAGLAPGAVHEFGPDGAVFPTPITVTMRYDPASLGGQAEDQLVMLTKVNGLWARIPGSSVDTAANTITAAVEHFTLIGTGYGDPTFIHPRSPTLVVGQQNYMLDATSSFSARLKYWKSETPSVATIGASTGVVTGVARGQAIVRVFVDDPTYQTATYTDEVYVSVVDQPLGNNQYAWFTQRAGWTGAHLYAIHGVSSNDFFMVGRGGVILRSNGTTVTQLPSGTTRTLLGVWARNANDAYVVGLGAPGTGSAVRRFDGTNWNQIYVDPAVTVYGVHGNSRAAFVAAGDRVLRIDATNDAIINTHIFPAGTTIRAIAAEDDGIVIAVGDNAGVGMIYRSSDDGFTWDLGQVPRSEIGPPASGPLTSVWRDPSNGFVAAASLDGRIVASGDDGGFWLINRRQAGSVFRALTSRPRGGSNLPQPEVFLGGDNGRLQWHWRCFPACPIENTGFTPSEAFNQDINGLWTAPDGTVWGVGLAGFIFHQDATPAKSFTVKSIGQPFADVWANGSRIDLPLLTSNSPVVVASATFESEVFTTTSFGTNWRGTPLDVNGLGFQGAYGSANGADVYLVGANGAIARGAPNATGYSFTMLNSGTTALLTDVWMGYSGIIAYAVGAGGTVLRTGDRGATWVQRGDPAFGTRHVSQVYGLGNDDVFVALEDGSVYRTQNGGMSWSPVRPASGEVPTGFAVVTPNEMYLGVRFGTEGRIVRTIDGTNWTSTTIPNTRFMSGVWRSPDGLTIIVAGSDGTVVISTDRGANWARQNTGTARDLYAVTAAYNGGAQGLTLFATGAAGTIITGVRPF